MTLRIISRQYPEVCFLEFGYPGTADRTAGYAH